MSSPGEQIKRPVRPQLKPKRKLQAHTVATTSMMQCIAIKLEDHTLFTTNLTERITVCMRVDSHQLFLFVLLATIKSAWEMLCVHVHLKSVAAYTCV